MREMKTYNEMSIPELQKEMSDIQMILFRKIHETQLLPITLGGCVCKNYRTGELTGGWMCPLHGHQM